MVKNKAHMFLCSNPTKPLSMDDKDRRFLVSRITEEKKSLSYWRDFYEWLKGEGHGIIRHWTETFVETPENVVPNGAEAPMSSRKAELIEESRSDVDRSLASLRKWRSRRALGKLRSANSRLARLIRPSLRRGMKRQSSS